MQDSDPFELGSIAFLFAGLLAFVCDGAGASIIMNKYMPVEHTQVCPDVGRVAEWWNIRLLREYANKSKTKPARRNRNANAKRKRAQQTKSSPPCLQIRYNCRGRYRRGIQLLRTPRRRGGLIYDRISYCAHDCDPNCCWNFGDKDSFVFRARRLASRRGAHHFYLSEDDLFRPRT